MKAVREGYSVINHLTNYNSRVDIRVLCYQIPHYGKGLIIVFCHGKYDFEVQVLLGERGF